jgi:hypothetical protein
MVGAAALGPHTYLRLWMVVLRAAQAFVRLLYRGAASGEWRAWLSAAASMAPDAPCHNTVLLALARP